MENEEKAGLISLASLTGKDIGDKQEREDKEKQETKEELETALSGKKDDFSFGGFVGDSDKDEEEKEEAPDKDKEDEGDSDEEVPDGDASGSSKDDPEGEDVPEDKPEDSNNYRSMLVDMFGDSVGTIVQEVDGEEVETPLSEIDIDGDLFKEIVQSKIDEEKELASEGKISTDGISDFAKSLIEIDRKGGDISQLLEMKKAYSDPLDNLDMSTVEGKKQAIYLRKKAANPDEDDQEIQLLIEMYEKKGLLDDKAEAAETELRGALEAEVERRENAAKKAEEDRAELLKNYRKDIKSSLTSQFKLNDKTVKRLVDMSTKADDKGRFELDDRYAEFRRDPKKAAKLALLMLDEEEFVKQITSEEVKNEKKKSGRIKLRSKTGSSTEGGTAKKGKKEDDLISMDVFGNKQ